MANGNYLRKGLMDTSPAIQHVGLIANHAVHSAAHRYLSGKIDRTNANLIFSPFGLSMTLGALRACADEQTGYEIVRAGSFGGLQWTPGRIGQAMKQIYEGLMEELPLILAPAGVGQKPTLHLLNLLFLPPRFEAVNQMKVNDLQEIYNCNVRNDIDLRNPHDIERINQHVSAATNGRVLNLMTLGETDMFNPLGMVGANVLYFKGLWEGHNAFDPAQTRTMPFTCYDGTVVNVPMMQKKKMYASYTNFFRYQIAVCALYFEGGRYALMIYYPRGRQYTAQERLRRLEERINELHMNDVADAMVRFHRRSRRGDGGLMINLTMPRIKMSLDTSMSNFLRTRTSELPYSPQRARFSLLHPSTPDKNLHLSDIKQRVTVDIDETAAPQHAAPIFPRPRASGDSRVKTKTLKLIRPFMFSIFDYVNNVNIVSATMYNPNERGFHRVD